MTSAMAVAFCALVAVDEPDVYCGSRCLYVSLKALDVEVESYEALEKRLGVPRETGYSLGQLAEVAREYGLNTLGVKTTVERLQRREERFACIALLNGRHFVNFGGAGPEGVTIVNPPKNAVVPLATLKTQWDGTALLLSPGPLAPEEDLGPPLWPRILIALGVFAAVAVTALLVRRVRRSMPTAG